VGDRQDEHKLLVLFERDHAQFVGSPKSVAPMGVLEVGALIGHISVASCLHSSSGSGSNNCSFRTASRSTETASEPLTAPAFSYVRPLEGGNALQR
jgi:hypothetical protein